MDRFGIFILKEDHHFGSKKENQILNLKVDSNLIWVQSNCTSSIKYVSKALIKDRKFSRDCACMLSKTQCDRKQQVILIMVSKAETQNTTVTFYTLAVCVSTTLFSTRSHLFPTKSLHTLSFAYLSISLNHCLTLLKLSISVTSQTICCKVSASQNE